MFERFTDRARQVVVLAQDESRSFRHDYIGTEHLLLGLLREEEGIGARVLESLDVTVEEVRARVAGIVGMGESAVTGQIPFTPRAKEALEASLREATSLGHHHIGTEHVLLGLVRSENDAAARILRELGVDPERVRNEIVRLLSGRPAEPKAGPTFAEAAGARTRVTFPPAFFAGWLSFGAALAVGVLVGWLIWG